MMELTGFLLTLSSLTVSPDRSQFFKYESLSLSCEDVREPSRWTVKAKTVRGVTECGRDWGFQQGSTCTINEAYSWNSGVYWCESTSGETSPAANISVTENHVILESPVSPVMEGESVTLRCSTKSNSSDLRASIFMKDRNPVGAAITGEMTVSAVSKSDEGLYMCVITNVGASAESWLAVRERVAEKKDSARPSGGFTGNVTEEQVTEKKDSARPSGGFTGNVTEGPGAPAASHLYVSRLICLLVVGTPYLLSTIKLGVLYRGKAKTRQVKETRNCDEVQMEEII
ncbi:Fc receptor-like protein 5 isoform X2 [Sparus aurata]|uniref:Fc receptor-like protein 5 isoform X2 n=1 Tax=Sparus aurata TaxID=8175 RepID=UPI0011C1A7D1|nr:Fc receptor-like protein 5 isoform X2 [Sparus aurata]